MANDIYASANVFHLADKPICISFFRGREPGRTGAPKTGQGRRTIVVFTEVQHGNQRFPQMRRIRHAMNEEFHA